MCDIDLEPCSVWSEDLVKKARKDHVCDMCHGLIAAGSSYIKHFSIIDREPTHEKMCLPCRDAADAFQDDHGQRSNPSYMRSLLTECVNEETFFTRDENGWRNRESESLTPAGQKWQAVIDAMNERQRVRKAS